MLYINHPQFTRPLETVETLALALVDAQNTCRSLPDDRTAQQENDAYQIESAANNALYEHCVTLMRAAALSFWTYEDKQRFIWNTFNDTCYWAHHYRKYITAE